MTEQTKQTLFLCFLSGMFCAFLASADCGGISNESSSMQVCHIMNHAISINSSIKLDWNWINWIPGALFGLAFGISNPLPKINLILFTLTSAIVYFFIGLIFALLLNPITYNDALKELISKLSTASASAGFLGAFLLTLVVKYFYEIPLNLNYEISIGTVGALSGAIFFLLGLPNEIMSIVFFYTWPLTFIVWQLSISFLLTLKIQRNSRASF